MFDRADVNTGSLYSHYILHGREVMEWFNVRDTVLAHELLVRLIYDENKYMNLRRASVTNKVCVYYDFAHRYDRVTINIFMCGNVYDTSGEFYVSSRTIHKFTKRVRQSKFIEVFCECIDKALNIGYTDKKSYYLYDKYSNYLSMILNVKGDEVCVFVGSDCLDYI